MKSSRGGSDEKKRPKKPTVLKDFVIDEISLVDHPAQRGARITLMKRADSSDRFEKRVALTNVGDYHQHRIVLQTDSEDLVSGNTETTGNHSHPWVKLASGDIQIGMVNGHQHTIDASTVVKSAGRVSAKTTSPMEAGEMPSADANAKSMQKRAVLTAPVDGHQHLIIVCNGREDLIAGSTDYSGNHTHAWVRDPETGLITVAMTDGHTHQVDTSTMIKASDDLLAGSDGTQPEAGEAADDGIGNREATMTVQDKSPAANKSAAAGVQDDVTKASEVLKSENDALKKRVDRAERVAEMTDAEKQFAKSLPDAAREEFIAKSASDRASQITSAAGSNPEVYRSKLTGQVFFKNDDPRMVELAKGRDEDRIELLRERAVRKRQDLEKRAGEDMAHYPGEVATKCEILGAIDSISDESVRAKALEIIKANNDSMSLAFQRRGSTGALPDRSGATTREYAEAELDRFAKSLMEKDPTMNYEDAYDRAGAAKPDMLEIAIAG